MNELQILNNAEFGELRTIEENSKLLFCGGDVAKALGYINVRDALAKHCKGVVKRDAPTKSGIQEMSFIPEGDVYRLICHSKLEGAERFERWVFDEVLPTIRQKDVYATDDFIERTVSDPEYAITILTALKDERKRRKNAEALSATLTVDLAIAQPKAAYFDELVDRNLLTGFRETAKLLKISEKKFVAFLIEHKYIYRDRNGKLCPHADKNNGLFEVKECYNEKTDWRGTQTLVTPKGRETFRLLCQGM